MTIEATKSFLSSWTSPSLATIMCARVDTEKKLALEALSNPWRRYPPAIIGGGSLNVGVLALEGASAFAESPILATTLSVCGALGGVLNIREGVLALEEARNAWNTDNKKLAVRLVLQGVLEIALGATMLVMAIGQFFGIQAIQSTFAANPYIMPALFFALSLFLLAEILVRLGPVVKGTDLGSQLQLDTLRKAIESKNTKGAESWVRSQIGDCFDVPAKMREKTVKAALNRFKAEIGFTAGTETFRLFEMILSKQKNDRILSQIEKVEQNIRESRRLLYLKLGSVLLCAGGFSAGMAAIAQNSTSIDGIQNLAMSAAAMIPLYLDIERPFQREIPIVISD